jgi:hypothetical protein
MFQPGAICYIMRPAIYKQLEEQRENPLTLVYSPKDYFKSSFSTAQLLLIFQNYTIITLHKNILIEETVDNNIIFCYCRFRFLLHHNFHRPRLRRVYFPNL